MIRHFRLQHQFVRNIPEHLEPGVLYISIEYGTAVHSCCCGCGEEVVTPFAPTDWQMTFDGQSVSLWPSIGNWKSACRSHYIIKRGKVLEALPWTDRQIANEWDRDQAAKAEYYSEPEVAHTQSLEAPLEKHAAREAGVWSRIRSWIGRRLSDN